MNDLSVVFELLDAEIDKYKGLDEAPNISKISIRALERFKIIMEDHETAKAERTLNILKARKYGSSKINYM